MHTEDDLWYTLLLIDHSWQVDYCERDQTILRNGDGQMVIAPTLYIAIEAALAISTVGEDNDTRRD